MNTTYIATVINSILRSTTPILLATLGSAICGKVGVFNVALEAQILIGCFTSIAVDYATSNVWLAVLAGILSGGVVAAVVSGLQVKYKAADMVVGTSLNLLVAAVTSFLLYMVFHVRGTLSDDRIVPLKKYSLPFIGSRGFIGKCFSDLTIIDISCYVVAVICFIFLYRTVRGYRVLSVGINKKAAESLGTNGTRIQMWTVFVSGLLCGLGGTALAMGQVTLFSENMSSGRGFIAMAAASMGMNHPILCIASSLFFGACQALGTALQGTIRSQITLAIPYIGTIIALVVFSKRLRSHT